MDSDSVSTAKAVHRCVERRVAAAEERGGRVVGYITRRDGLHKDVILSDDPPGSGYGICPPEASVDPRVDKEVPA